MEKPKSIRMEKEKRNEMKRKEKHREKERGLLYINIKIEEK